VGSANPSIDRSSYRGVVSSNVGQNYPYSSETEGQRSAAVATAVAKFGDLGERIARESTSLEPLPPAEPGRPHLWWVFVCPQHIEGRLHVAGYPLEKHGLYTVCDLDGQSFLR